MHRPQRGLITVDFIFGLTIGMGFFAILFALTFTLSVVEITQYITFASARNYMASHLNPSEQQRLAVQKYQQLVQNEVLAPLYRGGWFQLPGNPEVRDFTADYGATSTEGAGFWGTRVQLNAKMLAFNIPFLGPTFDDEDGFTTNIGSFLSREPTMAECLDFMSTNSRFNAIRQLDARFNTLNIDDAAYVVIADNGC